MKDSTIENPASGRRGWALAGAALLVAVCCLLLFLYADRSLARLATELPPHLRAWFNRVGSLGNSAWYLVPGILGYPLLRWLAPRAKTADRRALLRLWRQRVGYLLATVIASGLFADALKILLGRPRPKVFFGHQLYSFSFFEFSARMWSFPSGHATTAFAVATAGYFLWPRGRWLWFCLATAVALCRVLGGAHFPSDILAGAFIGSVSSLLLRNYFQKRRYCTFPDAASGAEKGMSA